MTTRFNWRIWLALPLSAAAFLSYHFVFVKWPATRDVPWVNTLLAAAATWLLVGGVRRAFVPPRRILARLSASIVALLSAAALWVFVYMVIVMPRLLPASANAPGVGQRAPEFTALDINGQRIALSDLLAKPQHVLLIFYMNSNCLACNSELHDMQVHLSDLEKAGVRPIAISSDPPDVTRRLCEEAGYTFTFLSDPDAATIHTYDLFDADEGGARPADFLLDSTGVVRWRLLTKNLDARARPAQVIAAAAALPTTGSHVLDVDPDHLDSPAPYKTLASWVNDAEIVGLAESIHMTHEFPLARLGLVKALHESAGFHALAFEGSPIDVWGAQDEWLESGQTPRDSERAMRALFSLWNTPEMQRVFDYAASTRDAVRPLYITAYDIQPGSGRDLHGRTTFDLLQERLRRYAPPPAGFDAPSWTARLEPLTDACQQFRLDHAEPAAGAITTLETWIAAAVPAVERQFPHLPHAAALRLLPASLRASLQLCRTMAAAPRFDWAVYKHTRDREAALFTVALNEAMGGRLLLWAHVSHLSYDSRGQNTSVAEELRRLKQKTFIIGTFAESGGAIVLFSDVNELIGYSRISGAPRELRDRLASLCPRDCLFSTSDPRLPGTAPQPLWVETGVQPVSLAGDFDAVLWLRHVHAPDLPMGRLAMLSVLAYIKPPRVFLVSAIVGLPVLGGLLLRPRRRTISTERRGARIVAR